MVGSTTHRFEMDFDLGNEAFDLPHKRAEEIARILRETASNVERGETIRTIMDVSGNRIGDWSFDECEFPEDDDGEEG